MLQDYGVSPASERVTVTVDGRELSVSNLAKPMYPATGFTKGELIDYYAKIAAVMLPHLRGRPVTTKRFPNGVTAGSFIEKNVPKHAARLGPHRRARAASPRVRTRTSMPSWTTSPRWSGSRTSPRSSSTRRCGGSTPQASRSDRTSSSSTSTRARRQRSSSAARSPCSCRSGCPATTSRCARRRAVRRDFSSTAALGRRGWTGDEVNAFAHDVAEAVGEGPGRPRRLAHDESTAQREDPHRLEPEQPCEDDRLAVLHAGTPGAVGVDSCHLGRGRASAPPVESRWVTSPQEVLKRVEKSGDLFAALLG